MQLNKRRKCIPDYLFTRDLLDGFSILVFASSPHTWAFGRIRQKTEIC